MTTNLRAIERLRNLSKEDFDHVILFDRPVIIEDIVQGWDAFSRWTPNYFAQKLGDLRIRVKTSSSHIHPDFEAARAERSRPFIARTLRRLRRRLVTRGDSRAQMRFDEFLGLVAKPDGFRYMAGAEELAIVRHGKWNETLAAVRADYELPNYVPESRLDSAALWVSGKGVRSHLHYDGNCLHNLNAQVTGSKHVQLYSPEQMSKVYPYLYTNRHPYTFSQVNVENVDTHKFPRFAEIEGFEGTMKTGDLLFIPAYWYHTFKHLGDFNTNVNFWWRAEFVRLTPVSARDYLGGLALDLISGSKIPPVWLVSWFRKFERHLTQSR